MPANARRPEPFTPDRHLDLQADLHFFFDTLVTGKRVLDVGAGLGQSKYRIRHNWVTAWEPEEACRRHVDLCGPTPPTGTWDVVTAFEVLEHVEDDLGFLRGLDALATEAVFVTTPNWEVARCQSAHHWREYTLGEFKAVVRAVWPVDPVYWFAYYKDALGGWCEMEEDEPHRGRLALKFAAIVNKALSRADWTRVYLMYAGR